jgi:hypothetical protein
LLLSSRCEIFRGDREPLPDDGLSVAGVRGARAGLREHHPGDERTGERQDDQAGERVLTSSAARAPPCVGDQRSSHEATITSTMLDVKIDRDQGRDELIGIVEDLG